MACGGLGMIPFAGTTKSKFFRVATEGATVDGREIKREWIDQAAKNFDPQKYGARVWLEHLRGTYPDSSFRAYGDVTAVEARDAEGGKRALFAQIAPLPDLVKIVNDQRQKIYTSIEINPKFADTGEAYLVGLAVTDSPASTGTEVLSFATRHPTSNAVSAPELATIELEEDTADADGAAAKFAERIKSIVAKFTGRADAQHQAAGVQFNALAEGIEAIATAATENAAQQAKATADLAAQFAALQTAHNDLVAQLGKEIATQHSQRPAATGNSGRVLADC